MEKKLANVTTLLKHAKNNNKAALEILHLNEGFEYQPPQPVVIANNDVIKDDLCTLMYMAAAADRLGLSSVEGIARRAIQYAMYTYNCVVDRRPRLSNILNGADVADEVENFIQDMCQSLDMLLKVDKVEKKRRQEKGDIFQEGDEGGNEKEDGEEHQEEDNSEQHQSEGEESQEGEEDAEPEKGMKMKKTKKKKLKQRMPSDEGHHLNRKCVVKGCSGYEGPNLKRHLQKVHGKKGHIQVAEVGKYFAMGLKPKKKRGPKRSVGDGKTTKGRWRRWCPERGCSYLGCYLPHHLQNKHRMNPKSSIYKLSLKVAKRYQGLQEIDDMPIEDVDAELQAAESDPEQENPSPINSELTPPTPKTKCKTPPIQEHPSEDSEDDSEACYSNQEEYFTDKHPTSHRHK